MMRQLKITLAAALLLASAGGQAGLYKCTDPATGKVTFSQTQCSVDAKPVDVEVHRPSAQEVEAHNRRLEEGAQWVEKIERERAQRAAARAKVAAIAAAEAQHAAEQAAIASRRARANNNAAGAALEGALATDAAAADARHNALMGRLLGE